MAVLEDLFLLWLGIGVKLPSTRLMLSLLLWLLVFKELPVFEDDGRGGFPRLV